MNDQSREDEENNATLPIAKQEPAKQQPADNLAGTVLLDDYVIERVLGHGGMGTVYLVRSKALDERFALKRARPSLLREPDHRRRFLWELLTWSKLPEHPHLTAFRFFRTLGDEIYLFAEYVPGGSLDEFIKRKLLLSLDAILDVAIQIAWGLHAAHESGIVHQDIKPGNVLITPEYVAKITDFGLSRARAAGTAAGEPGSPGSPLDPQSSNPSVSCRGLTFGYCSPEQAQWQPLMRQSDMWSWGLCVLEMFNGGFSWHSGFDGPAVLQRVRRLGPAFPGPAAMPRSVARVLDRCFEMDPLKRYATCTEIADELRQIYHEETGNVYPRPVPGFQAAPLNDPEPPAAWLATPDNEPGGYGYLVEACRLSGIAAADIVTFLPPRYMSKRAQALCHLIVWEEARQLLEKLDVEGNDSIRLSLANVFAYKSMVHSELGDLSGLMSSIDRAIEWLQRPVNDPTEENSWRINLSDAYRRRAMMALPSRSFEQSVADLDAALTTLAGVPKDSTDVFVIDLRGAVLGIKGVLYESQGQWDEALELLDNAIAIYDRAVNGLGIVDMTECMASTITARASLYKKMGRLPEALADTDQVIALREQVMSRPIADVVASRLASSYRFKGELLVELGDPSAGLAWIRTGINLIESRPEGDRLDDMKTWAELLVSEGRLLRVTDDKAGALAAFARAVGLWERLVHQEGSHQYLPQLATARLEHAALQPRHRVDLALVRESVAILRRGASLSPRTLQLLDWAETAF